MQGFSHFYKRILLLLLLLFLVVVVVVVVVVVEVVVKGKFVLLHAMKARMERRGIAPLVLILGPRGSQFHAPAAVPSKKEPRYIIGGWVADRPARSRSLY
jgi:hypothetical protein